MRPTLLAVVAILCLGFTLAVAPRPGWAEDSRSPHRIRGAAVRGGSIVGHSTFAGAEYLTLGGAVAAGGRFGRLTGEVEYDYLTLQSGGSSSEILGQGHRLAANARLDVLRLGRRWVGDNSLVLLWTEFGAGRQWTSWRAPELARRVDDDKVLVQRMDTLATRPSRIDTAVGFGWLLDHRSPRALGFPLRIGWLMGWRVTRAPGIPDARAKAACVAAGCPAATTRRAEHGLLVHSSLLFTW